MLERIRRVFRYSDWVLTLTLILLLLLGLSALYASGQSSESSQQNFIQQCLFIAVGFVLFFTISSVDYRKLRSFGVILYGLAAVLLIAVLFFGSTIRNTTGWFRIGDFGIQPIEFVKVLWILAMASFLVLRGHKMTQWKNILILSGFMLGLVFLALLQPDLGSSLIIIGSTIGVLLITNVRRMHILIVFLLLIAIFVVSWFWLLQGYQKERILVLFDPARDPLGGGYHVTQSIIAIGSGGWFGRGLGFGSQSQLMFLPEQQTDFIFAVIGEELGFVGAGFLLILFGILLYRCIRIAWDSSDAYGTFVAYGIMLIFFLHVIVNVGMNLGMFPVAGIPLPFVSYGGSSLLAMMIAAGVVQSIAVRNKMSRERTSERLK